MSREDFREIHQFYTFYPKIIFPWGGGHEIYNFLSPYPTDAAIHTKFGYGRQNHITAYKFWDFFRYIVIKTNRGLKFDRGHKKITLGVGGGGCVCKSPQAPVHLTAITSSVLPYIC